jgi:hypothetical protein
MCCQISSGSEKEQQLTEYAVGAYFGEIALLCNETRKASVIARGPTKVRGRLARPRARCFWFVAVRQLEVPPSHSRKCYRRHCQRTATASSNHHATSDVRMIGGGAAGG